MGAMSTFITRLDEPGWFASIATMGTIIVTEAWAQDRRLYERDRDAIGADVRALLEVGSSIEEDQRAHDAASAWQRELAAVFDRVQLLALPTLPIFPPRIDGDLEAATTSMTMFTAPVNVAGNPALSLPVPSGGPLPASLQLVGPRGGEELLVAAGKLFER
jgi:Asp-tRNA(Asn)/Glu-tRNA(Gln) amidotransferase A subunit family amidase